VPESVTDIKMGMVLPTYIPFNFVLHLCVNSKIWNMLVMLLQIRV